MHQQPRRRYRYGIVRRWSLPGVFAQTLVVLWLALVAVAPLAAQPTDTPGARFDRVRKGVEATLAAQGVDGALILRISDDIVVAPNTALPRVISIDAATDDLRSLLDDPSLSSPEIGEAFLATASEVVNTGIRAKAEGNIAQAILYYRFALYAACRYGEWRGMEVVTSNLWIAIESYKTELPMAIPPPYQRSAADVASPSDSRQDADASETELQRILDLVKHDAAVLAPIVSALLQEKVGQDDRLSGLMALRRLYSFAGDQHARHVVWHQLTDMLRSEARFPTNAFIATIEEFAATDLLEILQALGLLEDENGRSIEDETGTAFAETWSYYLAERQKLGNARDRRQLLISVTSAAFQNLQRLRGKTVTAGGSFGHRLSYLTSQILQPVGRDLALLLTLEGQTAEALVVIEETRARALGDWMARSHATNRLFMRAGQIGSVGEVQPASLQEIAVAAQQIRAPILIYAADVTGYTVWLQRPDGKQVSARIAGQEALIKKLFDALPYRSGGNGLGRGQAESVTSKADTSVDAELHALYVALFPSVIREALQGQGDKLVIIPDDILNYVPFAALRDESGRYLVETRGIVYWPSVTAWLLTESAAYVRDALAESNGESRTPVLVMGDPVFSGQYKITLNDKVQSIHLDPLPGTGVEARAIGRLFNTKPLLRDAASMEAIVGTHKSPRIVHIATHGVLNVEKPDESFLALSDGELNAYMLYEQAGVLKANLIMLSACETGLGSAHPDSSIGLTNAFLVAGANAVGSTLWKIRDTVTAQMMVRFYTELQRGTDTTQALREAQLELVRNPEYRHPYYWAAFKLVGRDDNPLE